MDAPVTPVQQVQQAVAWLLAANPLLANSGRPMDEYELSRMVDALIALIEDFDRLTRH